jgi:hypothetical protein
MGQHFALRGCSPRGHVRETRTVSGRIVGTSKPLIVGRLELTGRRDVLLATIKTGSATYWRQFTRFCRYKGIRYTVPSNQSGTHGATTVYECSGMPEALDELQELDCIDTNASGQPLDVKPPRDKSALHSGMVDDKRKHCRPTVVKLFGGWVAVIGPKGVTYGRS